MLMVLLNNRIKINPPKAASGTVKITTKGCLQELKVHAITRYALNNGPKSGELNKYIKLT